MLCVDSQVATASSFLANLRQVKGGMEYSAQGVTLSGHREQWILKRPSHAVMRDQGKIEYSDLV